MSSIGREVSGLGLVERGRLLVLLEGDYGVTTKINAVVEVLGFETEVKIKVALIDETDWFQPVDQLATVEVPASCLKVLTIEPSFVEKGMALAQEAHHKFFVPVVTTNPRDAHKSLEKCMSMLKEAVTLNPLNGEAWAYIMNVAEFRNSNQPVPNATGLVLTRGDQAVDFLYLQAGLRACGNLPPVSENAMLHASLRLNLAGALGNPPVNAFADEEVQLRFIMDNCVPAGTRCMTLDRMLCPGAPQARALRRGRRGASWAAETAAPLEGIQRKVVGRPRHQRRRGGFSERVSQRLCLGFGIFCQQVFDSSRRHLRGTWWHGQHSRLCRGLPRSAVSLAQIDGLSRRQ